MRRETAGHSQLGITTGNDCYQPQQARKEDSMVGTSAENQLRVQMLASSEHFKKQPRLQDKNCCDYKELLIYRMCQVLAICLILPVTSLFTWLEQGRRTRLSC